MAVSVVSFSFSMAAQPEHWNLLCLVLAFLTTLVYLRLQLSRLYSTVFCSIRRPYITFKLPRGDMGTAPRLRNLFRHLATGMCQFRYIWNLSVWSSWSRSNCHAVQRALSSGASVYASIMWFFSTSSHFISQFQPTRFPLITATRMCHFLPVHHLEWHFWPGQKVKT